MQSDHRQPFWPILRVVGKNPFWAFWLLTFLVVAILAATNVVSKYALKTYTEDQVKRINWDAIVYQNSDVTQVSRIKREVSGVEGVTSVVEAGSVKLGLGSFMHVNFAGNQTNIPWFMMISAERPDLLPPDLRPAHGGTVTALVGPQAMISPYVSKISVGDEITVVADNPLGSGPRSELFHSKLSHLVTPERLEIVKFFLDKFGSAEFIPDGALIVALPKDIFDTEAPRLAAQVHELSKPQAVKGGEGESSSGKGSFRTGPQQETLGAMLMPEFMHLISVDRSRIFTGWDL